MFESAGTAYGPRPLALARALRRGGRRCRARRAGTAGGGPARAVTTPTAMISGVVFLTDHDPVLDLD